MGVRVRLALAAVLLLLSAVAKGVSPTPTVSYGFTGGSVAMGALNTIGSGFRTWASSPTGAAAIVRDVAEVVVAGSRVAMAVTATIPWPALAATAAVAAAGGVGFAAGTLIYDEFLANRCLFAGASWYCDPGTPTIQKTTRYWGWRAGQTYTTEAQAADAKAADLAQYGHTGCTWTERAGAYYPNGRENSMMFDIHCASGGSFFAQTVDRLDPVVGVGCPTKNGYTGSPMRDGKCNTVPLQALPTQPGMAVPPSQASEQVSRNPVPPPNVGELAKELAGRGVELDRIVTDKTLSGPDSVAITQPTTTTYTPPGATQPITTTTPGTTATIKYEGDSYTYNTTSTTINTNTGTTVTTTAPPPADVITCGLPGKPACRMDETGTPTYVEPDAAVIERLRADDLAKRDAAAASVRDPEFGWFTTPPQMECQPIVMPSAAGLTGTAAKIPDIDPCGVVGDVRTIMAFLWPLAAAWLCFGWIRQTVTGG